MKGFIAIFLLIAQAANGAALINTNDIKNGSVTNVKLGTMANSTIKCNISGGTATPTDCTGGQIGTVVGALIGTNNLSDLSSATTARSNLSLASAATLAASATYGAVIASDGTNWVASTIAIPACVAISASDVDWSLGNCFTKTLSANTALTFSKKSPGQTIQIRTVNPASFTLTFPRTNSPGQSVLWAASTIPTSSTLGHRDIWTIFFDGTEQYGSPVQNF